MARVIDLLKERRSLSIELWPPRSDEAAMKLSDSLERLYDLRPTFASITYGAGGSTRERTHDLVVGIGAAGRTVPMAHLTCAAHTKEELEAILLRYWGAGIKNILALLGDPPADSNGPLPPGELRHAIELVEFAKTIAPFCVAVAAHPEGHPSSPDKRTDRRYLAEKLEVADFAITQVFFDVTDYIDLVYDLDDLGVHKPVLPGVMPITTLRSVERMAELTGAAVPFSVRDRVAQVASDPDAVRAVGIEIATELCDALESFGAPGLHFYTMNQVSATIAVCENLDLVPHS